MRLCLVVVLRGDGESGVPGIVWKVGFQETLPLIGWSGGVQGKWAGRGSVVWFMQR